MLTSTVVRATGQSASKSPVRGWVAYLTIKTASENFFDATAAYEMVVPLFSEKSAHINGHRTCSRLHASLSARDDDL
jgi:hypothetical protein